MNRYCIFAARKGSKRIKNKNMVKINNKPIIFFPINQAKRSKIFKKIYITTDCNKIISYVKNLGVYSLFKRAKKYSGDNVQIPDVLKNFFDEAKNEKFNEDDIFVFIYSTNIFLKVEDIKIALKKFQTCNYDFLIGVQEFSVNPMKSLVINNKFLKPAFFNQYMKKSQDLKKYYFHPGSFFIFKPKVFKKKYFIFPKKTGYYLHKKNQYLDIDDHQDLNFAKKIFKIFF